MKSWFIDLLLGILFFPAPRISISKEEGMLIDQLFESAIASPDKTINYNLTIPKYKFLHYLSDNKKLLFHGSNNPLILTFEPKFKHYLMVKWTKLFLQQRIQYGLYFLQF